MAHIRNAQHFWMHFEVSWYLKTILSAQQYFFSAQQYFLSAQQYFVSAQQYFLSAQRYFLSAQQNLFGVQQYNPNTPSFDLQI